MHDTFHSSGKNLRQTGDGSLSLFCCPWGRQRTVPCLSIFAAPGGDREPSPVSPKHIIIKYSGHGGGASFCSALSLKDTKKILAYGVKLFGQKFAIIDYGTNCMSGTTNILNTYKDYTDYMIVNQIDFGGWEWDHWDYEKYRLVDTDEVYHKMFKKGEKISKAAKRLARQHTLIWKYGKENMRAKRIPQSVTAVKMTEFAGLSKAMQKENLPVWGDLLSIIKRSGKKSLLSKYKKMIVYYNNNKAILGSWSSEDGYGLWLYGWR